MNSIKGKICTIKDMNRINNVDQVHRGLHGLGVSVFGSPLL